MATVSSMGPENAEGERGYSVWIRCTRKGIKGVITVHPSALKDAQHADQGDRLRRFFA